MVELLLYLCSLYVESWCFIKKMCRIILLTFWYVLLHSVVKIIITVIAHLLVVKCLSQTLRCCYRCGICKLLMMHNDGFE